MFLLDTIWILLVVYALLIIAELPAGTDSDWDWDNNIAAAGLIVVDGICDCVRILLLFLLDTISMLLAADWIAAVVDNWDCDRLLLLLI